ncbi:MAG: hypothetical protein LUD52_03735 [Opitutae bacterium]|nr:hypothetical protein [Opitutae bacterium]
MKKLIFLFTATILWVSGAICVHGANIKVVSVDFWRYPVLGVDGKTISGPDADLYLWKYNNDNANLAGELAKKVEETGDTDAAMLLCALSDRIFNPEKSVRYMNFVGEKYLPPLSSYEISKQEEDRVKLYPPVLRFYLFRIAHMHVLYRRFGYLIDCSIPAFAWEISGYFDEFAKFIEEIRKTGFAKENLYLDFLYKSMKETSTNVLPDFMYDEKQHEKWLAETDSTLAKVYLFGPAMSKTNWEKSDEASDYFVDINSMLAISSAFKYFGRGQNSKDPNDAEKSLYASYVCMRHESQLSNTHYICALQMAIIRQKRKEYAKLAELLALLRHDLTVMYRYPLFTTLAKGVIEFCDSADEDFRKEFGKSLAEYYPEEYARGCEMARKGFYEDQELEQRFEDSLRRRFEEREKKAEMDARAGEGM